jgi:hypothetical protein
MNNNSIKKILILAANPIDSVRLSLDREVSDIRDTLLQSSANRAQFAIEHRSGVRPGDLQKYMYEVKPQIVHFSGHGVGGTATGEELPSSRKGTVIADDDAQPEGLMFEDDNGRSVLVSGITLSNLCALFKEVKCVVLNACYSQQQAQEIVKHIPYVVGMKQAIGDIAARNFSQGFYRAIWDGRSIEEAFDSGKNAMDLANIPESLTPVLLKRSTSDRVEQIPANLEEPEGVVSLNSAFYIERPPVENRCYKAIKSRGALVRIKAPQQMGKSSLMIRILDYAKQQDYKIIKLNFQSADKSSFADLNTFLRWFCDSVGQQLHLPENVDQYWNNKIFDSKGKCNNFFQSYLLKTTDSPIVIALDDVDIVFQYPTIATDFFGMLRAWHESAKSDPIWENLRLIIAHSREVYIPLDINQSPFNVGVAIELIYFDREQIKKLATRYQLILNDTDLDKLILMLGGHPYLIGVALYHLKCQFISSLDKLLQEAPTDAGLFAAHLRRQLNQLKNKPQLRDAMYRVVTTEKPVHLSGDLVFQLHSMGLILIQDNDVIARCNLYRLYFRNRLNP